MIYFYLSDCMSVIRKSVFTTFNVYNFVEPDLVIFTLRFTEIQYLLDNGQIIIVYITFLVFQKG